MNDRVSELMLERELLGRSDGTGLAGSFILHLAVGALAFASLNGAGDSKPKRYVSIRLASPPAAPAIARPPRAPAPPAALPKPKEKPSPTAPTQKSLFGRSEKKLAPRKTAPLERDDEPAAVPAGEAFSIPSAGAAGVTGLDTSFPYTIYIERMITLVGKSWYRPQGRGDFLATVYFVIERDGRIREIEVEKESGSAPFDRAAYRAVLESSPLPPLPFGYSGTFLGVHLTFR